MDEGERWERKFHQGQRALEVLRRQGVDRETLQNLEKDFASLLSQFRRAYVKGKGSLSEEVKTLNDRWELFAEQISDRLKRHDSLFHQEQITRPRRNFMI